METVELRIGNLVLINNQETTVESIGADWVNINTYSGSPEPGDSGSVWYDYKEGEEEALEAVVKSLNDSGCEFYQNDQFEWELYIANDQIKELKKELAKARQETGKQRE